MCKRTITTRRAGPAGEHDTTPNQKSQARARSGAALPSQRGCGGDRARPSGYLFTHMWLVSNLPHHAHLPPPHAARGKGRGIRSRPRGSRCAGRISSIRGRGCAVSCRDAVRARRRPRRGRRPRASPLRSGSPARGFWLKEVVEQGLTLPDEFCGWVPFAMAAGPGRGPRPAGGLPLLHRPAHDRTRRRLGAASGAQVSVGGGFPGPLALQSLAHSGSALAAARNRIEIGARGLPVRDAHRRQYSGDGGVVEPRLGPPT